MAFGAQLAIFCLLLALHVSLAQRVCRAAPNGVAAVCEATLGGNWILLCPPASQLSETRVQVTWRLSGRELANHNLSLVLTNVTYEDTGVYRCIVASINGELEASTSSIRFIVREGRAPELLHDGNAAQLRAESCQSSRVVGDKIVRAMVTGYPSPIVMWFRDAKRTSRIISDDMYQLLPSGDLIVRDSEWKMENFDQDQNVLYITAVNDFGTIHYCVLVHWHYHGDLQSYETVAAKSANFKNFKCNHHGSSCNPSSPAHDIHQWHLILLGICIGYVLLIVVIILLAIFYHQLHYRHRHYCKHVNSEAGEVMTNVTELLAKADSDDFVYVVYSPHSENWVENTLMHKLAQWQLRYTTYDLSAIPGQPKVVEKLRLCSEASKIIIVLADDSLTEDTFLFEVLQVVSTEQTKVVPVLYGVTEEELRENIICRSITAYVSVCHGDVNFDIRLKQALS